MLSTTLKLNTRNPLKIKSIRPAVSSYEKQTSTLHVFARSIQRLKHLSYRIAHCIVKQGKPFTDREYIKDAFLSSADVLFDGLHNKETVKSRIKDIPVSARTVQRHIEEMVENGSEQQIAGLKKCNGTVFSIALDESMDINNIPHSHTSHGIIL